ncbi:MAG TPA: Zn-dependent alcohol dehydrogenase [Streptosporangiaceae bacterium]|nr:Zn-dependent alcohol dehydrogenase [Streptosporangiaceae bacterium]
MKAAVLFNPGEELKLADVELAPPGPREVRVRLSASGVCASDWHTMTGAIPSPAPCVLGHEGAGVVDAVGDGVTTVSPGDHVVLSWVPACGRCRYCEGGRPNLCATAAPALLAGTLVSGERRLRLGGMPLYHYSFLSTFAESVVVDEASCIPIRTDVPLTVAALVGCAVTTGFCAVTNRARVTPGSTVLIFGAGGVGLSAVMAAKLSGAGQIVVLDPVPSKRELASAVGASHVLDPASTDTVAEVRAMTGGEGADFAIEAAGRVELVSQAFEATRRGGTIVAVGVPAATATVHLPGPDLVRHEKIVTGSLYGSCRPRQDMPAILDLYAGGRLPLDRLVTRIYPLEDINQAFSDMLAGELARGVIDLIGDGSS